VSDVPAFTTVHQGRREVLTLDEAIELVRTGWAHDYGVIRNCETEIERDEVVEYEWGWLVFFRSKGPIQVGHGIGGVEMKGVLVDKTNANKILARTSSGWALQESIDRLLASRDPGR
jgi:hypothetical protein